MTQIDFLKGTTHVNEGIIGCVDGDISLGSLLDWTFIGNSVLNDYQNEQGQ